MVRHGLRYRSKGWGNGWVRCRLIGWNRIETYEVVEGLVKVLVRVLLGGLVQRVLLGGLVQQFINKC